MTIKPIINFAHRGASAYCPENTMAAFHKALELGATGIETDVQVAKDGTVVIIHDETLTRTTGDPRLVKDINYEEMKALDAGSWFDPTFAGESIPSLEQLLQLLADKDTILNIELKNTYVLYPDIERKTIELVHKYNMADRVIISSFNHYALAACKDIDSSIRTGILYVEGLYEPWNYAATLRADALHASKYAVIPEWVLAAQAHGIAYHPYTVNEINELEKLVAMNVDGIITDYPDRLAELLNKRGAVAE